MRFIPFVLCNNKTGHHKRAHGCVHCLCALSVSSAPITTNIFILSVYNVFRKKYFWVHTLAGYNLQILQLTQSVPGPVLFTVMIKVVTNLTIKHTRTQKKCQRLFFNEKMCVFASEWWHVFWVVDSDNIVYDRKNKKKSASITPLWLTNQKAGKLLAAS